MWAYARNEAPKATSSEHLRRVNRGAEGVGVFGESVSPPQRTRGSGRAL